MNAYLMLIGAIIFEVLGTMLLPASQSFTKTLPTTILIISYGLSFYFLALVSQQLPLSIIYASWAGLGVFLIAVLSKFLFEQSLSWQVILGLILIIIGVILVNTFSGSHGVE